jgi:tetratricopeptide (TPR) repeat protein
MLLAKQKKSAEAVESFREALRLDPTYLPVRLKLAENLLAAGMMEDSWQIYSGILMEFPDSAEAHYGLGRISVFQGKLTAARQSLRRACELFPPYGAAHYALAQVDQKLGENADAEEQIKLYEQNMNVVPPVEDPLRDALRALDRGAASHLERGLALDQVGRLDDALAETERAAELDPTMVKAHINLIILYGRKGDFQKAEEHFQTAVRLNPNQFPDAYYNYGVLLVREGKLDGAEKAFRQVLEISPSYADAHNNLGNLLERQGKLQQAIAEYKEAIESKPDFRQAHFNLGRILVSQQQYPEGIGHLQQTLTPVDESTPAYLYALGAAYGRAGDHQNALRYLRQARDEASGRGQAQLLASIEKDLQSLEAGKETH